MKSIISLTILIGLLSCQNSNKEAPTVERIQKDGIAIAVPFEIDTSNIYDIQLILSEVPINHRYQTEFGTFSKDSLYLFIESKFENATILVEKNDNLYKEYKNVTTKQSLGAAKGVNLGNIHNWKSLGIRINNGPLIYCEPVWYSNIVTLNYYESSAILKFIGKPNIYE